MTTTTESLVERAGLTVEEENAVRDAWLESPCGEHYREQVVCQIHNRFKSVCRDKALEDAQLAKTLREVVKWLSSITQQGDNGWYISALEKELEAAGRERPA